MSSPLVSTKIRCYIVILVPNMVMFTLEVSNVVYSWWPCPQKVMFYRLFSSLLCVSSQIPIWHLSRIFSVSWHSNHRIFAEAARGWLVLNSWYLRSFFVLHHRVTVGVKTFPRFLNAFFNMNFLQGFKKMLKFQH